GSRTITRAALGRRSSAAAASDGDACRSGHADLRRGGVSWESPTTLSNDSERGVVMMRSWRFPVLVLLALVAAVLQAAPDGAAPPPAYPPSIGTLSVSATV